MRLIKNRKVQGSLEFVSIASFMFLVFIATFITIESRMSGVYQEKVYKNMDELSKLVAAEIRMAEFSPGDYKREFFLPSNLGGFNYSINVTDKSEVVIHSEDLEFVVFLDQNISGDISKGKNRITKIDDVINISYLCLGGPDSDDDRCGVIDCSGWYAYAQNTEDNRYHCFNKTSITENRCEDFGRCKSPNTIWCDHQPNNAQPVYVCNRCQRLQSPWCTAAYQGYIGSCQFIAATDTGLPCGNEPGYYCNNMGQCCSSVMGCLPG